MVRVILFPAEHDKLASLFVPAAAVADSRARLTLWPSVPALLIKLRTREVTHARPRLVRRALGWTSGLHFRDSVGWVFARTEQFALDRGLPAASLWLVCTLDIRLFDRDAVT